MADRGADCPRTATPRPRRRAGRSSHAEPPDRAPRSRSDAARRRRRSRRGRRRFRRGDGRRSPRRRATAAASAESRPAVPDRHARRPHAHHASRVRRPVEDQLDGTWPGRGPHPPDERRPGAGPGSRDRVEQVRAVDEQPLDTESGCGAAAERATSGRTRGRGRPDGRHRRRTRDRGPPLRLGRVACSCSSTSTASSIAAPTPCRASPPSSRTAPPRGDDVVYVTNNSMHYRADYVTRLTAMGAPVSAGSDRQSAARDRPLPREHQPRVRRVLDGGRRRAGARAARRRPGGRDRRRRRRTRMAQEGIDGLAAAGRPGCRRAGVDPEADVPPARARPADCIRAGALFIATNRDPVYPTERWLRPGAGSSRRGASRSPPASTPLVIGKPEPPCSS